MKNVSRRRFMGTMLGIGGATMVPGLVFPAALTKTRTESPQSNASSVLETIKNQIEKWRQEGQAFKYDQLNFDNEEEWNRLLQNYFDLDKFTCTSINSANLCPSLRQVDQMVALVQQMLDADISFPMRAELAQASLGYGLDAIKDWLGLNTSHCEPQCLVALTRNTTEGNNFINNGLVSSGFFRPQKHNIVVWDVNHPTNFDAWYYRKATQGWGENSVRKLQTKMFSQTVTEDERRSGMIPSDPQNEDDIIIPLKNLLDGQTKMVTLSWQSNECGMLLPMDRIVAEVRSINRKIHVHADSAQTFGVLDLQLDKIDVDSITGSFHKWPCGPKMVGIIYMNKNTDAAKSFIPNNWGYDEYIKTPADYGYEPVNGVIDSNTKRFSYLGQQNDATLVSTWIAALFHTGHFHPNVSPDKIEARIHYLGDHAKDALYRNLPRIFPKFTAKTAYKWISTPTTKDRFRSSVFLFKVPDGIEAGDVMKNVYERHQYAIANLKVKGHDLLRISPTISNTSKDVNDVVEAIADVILAMQKGNLANWTHLRSYS
ncbi:MAG: aminotransferase class V-fold PLP-dependent enzyme [Deltaproteobacteria bacterium]|nr:aminotransferase class V-fold PLP-dependent enzyme [Deltaproteobacteria bacterium]MBW2171744.1 aminotransferase class V-fold PLP-dependent enzyme [Deltaproteobacteria bacterium]